jgi:hypothetical protein
MVGVRHMEARSDQNDLKNKTRLSSVQQYISKHGAWFTRELEKDLDSFRDVFVFGWMRASGGTNQMFLIRYPKN